MIKIKAFFRYFFYLVFRQLTKLNTTFFSDSFIALGYFIKSEAEYNKSAAVNLIEDRFELHDHLAAVYVPPQDKIQFMEFGVRWGQIINKWAEINQHPDSLFTGFDTFTGLPEDWGSVKKGSFSNQGDIPYTEDPRTSFCVGLVQDTLPGYVKKMDPSRKLIINLDFDLYNATLFALLQLQPIFKKGDIIILDEYFSISKNHHEHRAFYDFLSLYKIAYKPLFKCRGGQYVIELI